MSRFPLLGEVKCKVAKTSNLMIVNIAFKVEQAGSPGGFESLSTNCRVITKESTTLKVLET